MVNVSSIKTILGMILLVGITTAIFYWQFSFIPPVYSQDKYLLSIGNKNYDLNNPSEKHILPKNLKEISGLSFYKDSQLGCIQDENGILFIYDYQSKEVVREEKFGKDGDYEGIEIIRDTAYIIKSNGEISFFSIQNKGLGETKFIETSLTSKNNLEGLGFISSKNSLALICKDNSSIKKEDIDDHAIFQVELSHKKFSNTPYITFSDESLKHALDQFDLDRKNHLPFKPSAMAIHPETHEFLIISSVGKLLLKLDSNGKINMAIPLKRKIFTQPEGICFNDEGTLFISSEGRNDEGYILEFRPL